MPNFDTGHYFLTVLAPLRTGSRDDPDGLYCRQALIEALARLPNSEVTADSRGVADGSPFARNRMTHLARFVLIDDLPYNGRENGDTLLGKLGNVDPLVHQPVDRLTVPFLLFAADFDAEDGGDASLRRFTDALWHTMEAELRDILGNCLGFAGVATGEAFLAYVKRCQVETTMPFNDYYALEPQALARSGALPPDLPLPLGAIKIGAMALLGVAALWLLGVLLAAALSDGGLRDAAGFVARWGLLVVPPLLAGAAAYLHTLYRRFMARGAQPLPRSASLPDVLKSIYLQQRLAGFVIDNQGADPAGLHAAFGRFLAEHRPDDPDAPTQEPGLIARPDRPLPKGAAA